MYIKFDTFLDIHVYLGYIQTSIFVKINHDSQLYIRMYFNLYTGINISIFECLYIEYTHIYAYRFFLTSSHIYV